MRYDNIDRFGATGVLWKDYVRLDVRQTFTEPRSRRIRCRQSQLMQIYATYPEPINDDTQPAPNDGRRRGVRVGIIARETADEAWDVAYERVPDTRAGRITHGLAVS
jgi:hypothetical protein